MKSDIVAETYKMVLSLPYRPRGRKFQAEGIASLKYVQGREGISLWSWRDKQERSGKQRGWRVGSSQSWRAFQGLYTPGKTI